MSSLGQVIFDLARGPSDVRYSSDSDQISDIASCRLCAINDQTALQQMVAYSTTSLDVGDVPEGDIKGLDLIIATIALRSRSTRLNSNTRKLLIAKFQWGKTACFRRQRGLKEVCSRQSCNLRRPVLGRCRTRLRRCCYSFGAS